MSRFSDNIFDKNNSGEIQLSELTFIRLRDTIYKLSGIYFNESKKYLLETRVLSRVYLLGMDSIESYLQLISSLNGREELKSLLDIITINETYFFRAESQIEALERYIIPEIIRLNNKKTIKIWSAACSTGEEPYTIAMIIDSKLKDKYPDVKFEILGSDLSQEVIKNAEIGLYSEYSIRNVPKEYMLKYFTRENSKFKLSNTIKKMVTFKCLNLYDSFAINQLEMFDVIFCENVLIYFDVDSKEKVVESIYNKLFDGAYLFVGETESLHNVKQNFNLIHFTKAMAYRR